jgi:hypothetical protein
MAKRKATAARRKKEKTAHEEPLPPSRRPEREEDVPDATRRQIKRLRVALKSRPVDVAVILTEAHHCGLPASFRARCWLALLGIEAEDASERSEGSVCLTEL